MKKDIHPAYQKLKLRVGDEAFETMSTITSGEILLDVDFRKHPAWTGKGVTVAQSNQTINAFNDRFGGLTFGTRS